MTGQLVAAAGVAGDRLQQADFHFTGGAGKQAQQVREHVVIADEGRHRARLAITQVANGDRLYGYAAVDGTAQQATVEGAQGEAVGGGAFGEDQQVPAALQVSAELVTDLAAVAGAALDEQGAALVRQPAGQRPGAHFRLGQKGDRLQGTEQRNVRP